MPPKAKAATAKAAAAAPGKAKAPAAATSSQADARPSTPGEIRRASGAGASSTMEPLAPEPPAPQAKAGVPKAKAAPGKAAGSAKAAAGPKAGAKAAAAAPTAEEEARRKEEEEKAKAEAAAAEAEAARRAEEEAQQRAAAEAELKRLAALANGEVTIKYSMYAERFPIEAHKLTAATIDELYCLSDVMPGCFIHLADKEFAHGEDHSYVKEDPPGTFCGLMAGETYWCYVQQDPEQEKRDQEAIKKQWAGAQVGGGIGDRGSEGETCSCGWGAPCTNPMICKDYENRFANAIKAGGNPLLFV